MRIPEIFPSDPIQRQKVLSTVLMDFSADPCVLWVCPEAGNYINFIGALDAYRGSQSILIRPMRWGVSKAPRIGCHLLKKLKKKHLSKK